MGKVLENDGFGVYIYEDEHPPPHCHVRFNSAEEVVVGLPLLEPWYGKTLRRRVRRFLEDNLERLCEEWDQKHPNRNKV